MKIIRLAKKSKFISSDRKEFLIDVWKELHVLATLALMEEKFVYKIKMYDVNTKKLIHNFTTDWVDFRRYDGDIDYAINEMLCRYDYWQERENREEKYLNNK